MTLWEKDYACYLVWRKYYPEMLWLKTTNIMSHGACGPGIQEWLSWVFLVQSVSPDGSQCPWGLQSSDRFPRAVGYTSKMGHSRGWQVSAGCLQETSAPLLTGVFTGLVEYHQAWWQVSPRMSALRGTERDKKRESTSQKHSLLLYLLSRSGSLHLAHSRVKIGSTLWKEEC